MFNGYWMLRLRALPWLVIIALLALGGFGMTILYSAAGGHFNPWATKHALRFGLLFTAMLVLSQVHIRLWVRYAYAFYAAVLIGLILVEISGQIRGGGQRWLDLGFIQLQPSEFMKLAIILALARYYHFLPRPFIATIGALWPPLLMIAVPAALVMLQPDLGTALSICFGGIMVMFLAGVPLWLFLGAGAAGLASMPIIWSQLHDYQRNRVLVFLDPASDPLGAGYHITQSKIAIGSGGWAGKGFLQGSQSHLDYLPELQTDFIFATMAEEWGLLGGAFIILAFGVILGWAIGVALRSRAVFGKLVAMGLASTLFFYLAINMMMVMGLAPVVGIPLPLISYGGSAMMTVLILMGILMSLSRQHDEDMLTH